MAWTDLTFGAGSVLTGTKMTQLDENFDALAAQNAGAPLIFFPNSGTYGAQVFSLATVYAESGFVGPEVSSLATVHAGSGFVGPEVSSLASLEVASGFTAPESSSLGHLSVSRGITVADITSGGTPTARTLYGDTICKAWISFDGTGTISIRDSFNVASITDEGTGDYTITWDLDFASADYAWTGSSQRATSGTATDISFIAGRKVTGNPALGSLRVSSVNHSGSFTNEEWVNIVVFGDQ